MPIATLVRSILTLALVAAGIAAPASGAVTPPPAGAQFDYQIGGGYPPASAVGVVDRDRTDPPAAGKYNVCYINAFQTQPDAVGWWRAHHSDLLLKSSGRYVVDSAWNEMLLDTSTARKRRALATIVGRWMAGCRKAGYQAVEPDNLDSWSRSKHRLSMAHNKAYAALLIRRAHAAGLAIAQKNTTDLLAQHKSIGFDFAVTEECGRYGECEEYASAYANRVFDIEYSAGDFAATCRGSGAALSVVLRGRDVSPPGSPDYLFKTC
jgi:hypothetical protein